MTKYFSFNKNITRDTYSSFLEFVNTNSEDNWEITIDSSGGLGRQTFHIISIINSRSSQYKTKLVCLGAYSAAFLIFHQTKCKKVLATTCRGMFHYGLSEVTLSDNGEIWSREDEVAMKDLKRFSVPLLNKIAAKFMKKKELKQFKKGWDVYLSFKRMKEIFPDAEII